MFVIQISGFILSNYEHNICTIVYRMVYNMLVDQITVEDITSTVVGERMEDTIIVYCYWVKMINQGIVCVLYIENIS